MKKTVLNKCTIRGNCGATINEEMQIVASAKVINFVLLNARIYNMDVELVEDNSEDNINPIFKFDHIDKDKLRQFMMRIARAEISIQMQIYKGEMIKELNPFSLD